MKEFRCIYACAAMGAIFAADTVFADTVTIGPNGINSAGLTDFNGDPLTGAGISIGQVEAERPGKPGFDNTNSNFGTIPQEVFLLDDRVSPTADAMDEIINPGDPPIVPPFAHATLVAGVMIGKDPAAPGVAQDANLYASAGAFPTTPALAPLDALAITSQFIATRDNDNVRAVNLSFTVSFEPGGGPDGNSLFTQFVDWSARQHDVLYVVANRRDTTAINVAQPTDNYNGMTVAASEIVGAVYSQVAAFNHFLCGRYGSPNIRRHLGTWRQCCTSSPLKKSLGS